MNISVRASVPLLAAALITLSACGSDVAAQPSPASATEAASTPPAAPSTPAASPATTPPATSAAPATVEVTLTEQELAVQYLNSRERDLMYRTNVAPAMVRIAEALSNGELGETYQYDELSNQRQTGYTGWGGIATTTETGPSAYAWVYYNQDGSIDYGRGIRGISLYPGGNTPGIQIDEQNPDLFTFRWGVLLETPEGGPARMTGYSSIGAPPADESVYDLPESLEELQQLDRDAITALNQSMQITFGPDWN